MDSIDDNGPWTRIMASPESKVPSVPPTLSSTHMIQPLFQLAVPVKQEVPSDELHILTVVVRRNASERVNFKSVTHASAAALALRFNIIPLKLGAAKLIKMPSMATTIISSINENPF